MSLFQHFTIILFIFSYCKTKRHGQFNIYSLSFFWFSIYFSGKNRQNSSSYYYIFRIAFISFLQESTMLPSTPTRSRPRRGRTAAPPSPFCQQSSWSTSWAPSSLEHDLWHCNHQNGSTVSSNILRRWGTVLNHLSWWKNPIKRRLQVRNNVTPAWKMNVKPRQIAGQWL